MQSIKVVSLKELHNETKESGIFKFYDNHCGRFFINFNELNEKIVTSILKFLRSGYAMNVCDDGYGNKVYVLFSIAFDTKGCMELNVCRENLYEMLHTEGRAHYFTTMSLKQYSSSKRYQDAIDYVLEKSYLNSVNGWSIALTINENNDFEFVEVLNVCE